jgi:peptide/nickel transport system permease protein
MAIADRQISFRHTPAPQVEVISRRPARSLLGNALRTLGKDTLTILAASILVLLAVLAALAPVITQLLGLPANSVDLTQRFQPPSMAHPLGTDDFGRDQLARLLFGARVSLSVGFLAAAINLTVGVGLGMTAALYGGRVDDVISWLINTVRSIPGLFLVLIVASMFRVGPEGLG